MPVCVKLLLKKSLWRKVSAAELLQYIAKYRHTGNFRSMTHAWQLLRYQYKYILLYIHSAVYTRHLKLLMFASIRELLSIMSYK